jgi:hypothetical protein
MHPSADYPFGYCTNVHAGVELDQCQANLLEFAAPVRDQVAGEGRLPIGLWLSETAAFTLIEQGRVGPFAQWLSEHRFLPYTFNGFPQGNFHQPIVKQAVYEPTWTCESRLRYTEALAEIMEAILPSGQCGSISTLPLGWPHAPWHAENYKGAADNLLAAARYLDRLREKNAVEIVLAIEPEPGCVLNTAEEVIDFFEHYLFSGPDEAVARRHLTVCHDVCHSGVMFESQAETLQRYRDHGIRIGKVQVSSAVHVPWDALAGSPKRQLAALQQLSSFSEPRYLHQTSTSTDQGTLERLLEDLPQALQLLRGGSALASTAAAGSPQGAQAVLAARLPVHPWRVHFHVPIYVDRFGELQTTQGDIATAAAYLETHRQYPVADRDWFTGHYEVETYAWTVLPTDWQAPDLASGIARELEYFKSVLAAL